MAEFNWNWRLEIFFVYCQLQPDTTVLNSLSLLNLYGSKECPTHLEVLAFQLFKFAFSIFGRINCSDNSINICEEDRVLALKYARELLDSSGTVFEALVFKRWLTADGTHVRPRTWDPEKKVWVVHNTQFDLPSLSQLSRFHHPQLNGWIWTLNYLRRLVFFARAFLSKFQADKDLLQWNRLISY